MQRHQDDVALTLIRKREFTIGEIVHVPHVSFPGFKRNRVILDLKYCTPMIIYANKQSVFLKIGSFVSLVLQGKQKVPGKVPTFLH